VAEAEVIQSQPARQPARQEVQPALPPLQSHPLPDSLVNWQNPADSSDYFDAITPTPVGYLVWSRFPIQVYVQPGEVRAETAVLADDHPAQLWDEAVQQAIQEWNLYLPLALTSTADQADIIILRAAPPLQSIRPGHEPLVDRLPRVRSAESRYEILLRHPAPPAAAPPTLIHRFTLHITPNQTPAYTLATARHELGHALGIWGHSPIASDSLYFAQVGNPAPISSRDVNTLKRIYQQPTRLGWALTHAIQPSSEATQPLPTENLPN
jgi:predicted Zn-dependent protease